jgi:hypothetical protein
MRSAAECRAKADELTRLARASTDPGRLSNMLTMAAHWRSLAMAADLEVARPSDES